VSKAIGAQLPRSGLYRNTIIGQGASKQEAAEQESIPFQDYLSSHGYLASNLLGLPAVIAFIILAGRLRWSVVAAGAIELAHSPPLVWFNGVYWNPERLGGTSWGVEDVLVSFSLGAGVWFAAMWPFRSTVIFNGSFPTMAGRFAAIAAPTTMLAWVVWRLGAGVMETLLIVMAVTIAVLGSLFPRRLRFVFAAVRYYPIYYLGVLFLTEWLYPGFFAIWDGSELWDVRLFGLPAEEILFVLFFCACYPLIVATVFGADPQGARSSGHSHQV
jgi:hypothetical protein